MKNMKLKKQFKAISALVMAVLFVSAGCSNNVVQERKSSVSVVGSGTVSVKPDMLQMSISISKTAQTTKSAQEEIGKMVRQALDVLKNSGVEDKDITTASLTFNSEYNYRPDRRVLIGQRAEQTITFSIHDIQADGEKASQIIDRLVQINGIELNQMGFSVKNNTEHFAKSRELAFRKAEEKAKQYAELSGLKVARVLSISEETNQHNLPVYKLQNNMQELSIARDDAASTMLPAGELEITTKILAEFILE
jgi:uncharacterized protein YggE